VLALLTLLINVNRNNSEMTKSNRVIENGRFTLQMLEPTFPTLGSGLDSCPNSTTLLTSAPPPMCRRPFRPMPGVRRVDAQYKTNLIGIPLQAYEIPAVVPSPTVPVCAARVVNPQPAPTCCWCGISSRVSPGSIRGVPRPPPPTSTSRSPAAPTPATPITRPPPTPWAPRLHQRDPLYKRDCVTRADPYKLVSDLYYVRNYAVTPGDGVRP